MADPEAYALFQQHGAQANLETAGALEDHFAAHGFTSTNVIQPALVDQLFVHLSVHLCLPTPQHPFVTLFTTGMSDRAQAVPSEAESSRFSELMMLLPPDWPGMSAAWAEAKPPEFNWVMAWLMNIARYPHQTGKWIGRGHTFPTGDPTPLPGTGFTGFALLPPLTVPAQLRGRDGRPITLHTLMPLYPEELELKRKKGIDEILRRFADAGILEVVDPNRPNVGARKSMWPFA